VRTLSPTQINALFLTSNGIGESYFIVKDQFEAWGWNVTTAGLSGNHTGCPNKDPIKVPSDILMSEITSISEYDCVFVASGAQHHILRARPVALNLLKAAHDEGLVVATLCVSAVIFADAGIIDGIRVTGHSYYDDYMIAAGGIFKSDARVVSDKRIITGCGGTGGLGGHQTAPIYELCVAIAKELLGVTYVHDTSVTSSSGMLETEYQIKVELANQTNLPQNMNSSDASRALAYIYRTNGNYSFIKRVELSYSDNFYSGILKNLEAGNYTFFLEVINEDGCIEVVRNTTTFSVESTFPSLTLLLISLIFLSLSGLGVLIGFYFKKFKR
jgi:putative intracellular protease/amidase